MEKGLSIIRKALAALMLGSIVSACQRPQQPQSNVVYDLLLEKAQIIDGSGAAPYVANLLILGDSIALIDKDTSVSHPARQTILGRGMVLTPGFIDTHAHGNPLETPAFKNFLAMGVTTICLGQDGFSPDQENLSKWMDSMDAHQPGVNVAMFVGHNTLRLLSGVNYDTIPAEKNFAAMEKLLGQALEAGCYGLTTGLEYTPGYYATSKELNRLAKVVGSKGGLIMSHMRNEDDAAVEASILELLEQGAHCPVHVSHIKVVYGKGENRAREILALLDKARRNNRQVTADFYPYTASYTGIAILFPDWAKKPFDYQQVLRTRRTELRTFLENKITQRNGPEATLIGSGPFLGKTLEQIAQEKNKHFADVLIDDIGPYGASGAYFIMDENLQQTLLTDPHVMVCTDGSPTMNHPRGYGTFAKIIETHVQDKQLLSLPEAIRKMTGLPAQTIGMHDRGSVKVGYKADLLLFDPAAVKENATYENPHQLSSGFSYVIIAGKVAKEGDRYSENRLGKVVKKQRTATN